jgi:hypothetical protein
MLLILGCSDMEDQGFILNVDFGTSSDSLKVEISKMVNEGKLISEITKYDTLYYRDIKFNNYSYKTKIYFNDDAIDSGPLRSYSYSLRQLPYNKSGNDTMGINPYGSKKEKTYNLNHYTVILKTDLDSLKNYLNDKYGEGILESEKKAPWSNGKIKTYRYSTENTEIFLDLGDLRDDQFYGTKVKFPFYDYAYIEVKSKDYNNLLNKEIIRRRQALTPDEVLQIYFKQPYVEVDPDTSEELIALEVTDERLITPVLDSDVIEFKGDLLIRDAYNKLLLKEEDFQYIFSSPLHNRQEWRTVRYPVYTLNSYTPNYEEIKNLISKGSKLKVKLRPTIVALANGEVIK